VSGKVKVYLVGNAHIDPVWLWRRSEGRWVTRSTVRSVLRLMDRHPRFTFAFSSSALYRWLEESEPELLEAVRRRVREGRWAVVGGWVVEPDCNIPCGESFVRHALYGKRYFRERLGVDVRVGYNIDSFGHCAGLPQVLRKSGLEYYVFMRPNPRERELPSYVFWWEGADGSRVLAYRLPINYAVRGERLREALREYARMAREGVGVIMCIYGRGDHGGGPTEEDLRIAEEAAEELGVEVVFGTPEDFFKDVASRGVELPVVRGELQHHARGCYSAHRVVKKLNRAAEHGLLAAERLAVVAHVLAGLPYPRSELREAWERALFSQFHDSLAGTCIPEAYEDVKNMYHYSLDVASQAIERAAHAVAARVDTSSGESLVVFNPVAARVRWPVEVEPAWPEGKGLVSPEGGEVACQQIQPSSLTSMRRVVFVAELPPLGYVAYRIAPSGGSAPSSLTVRDHVIESERFLLEVDLETGLIKRLYDKRHRVDVFSDLAPRALVIDDPSDTWSHGVDRFDRVIGAFEPEGVSVLERGPVRGMLRAKFRYGRSRLWQDYVVYADLDFIELRLRVKWLEERKVLKLSFPVNLSDPALTCEVPYGVVARPCNGEEEPMQRWIDLSGMVATEPGELPYGLAVVNDGIYSYSAEGAELRLTLLRSPLYAHHDPHKPEPGLDYEYVDHGIHRFRFLLVPHAGDWRQVRLFTYAELLNMGLPYVIEDAHPGSLPRELSLVRLSSEEAAVGALKLAEDSDDLVLRLYETSGRGCKVLVELPPLGRSVETSLGPHELKTLRVPRDRKWPVRECNLLEE